MEELFRRYIDICNKALAKNAGRFPFEQIIMGAQNENGQAPECHCIVGNKKDHIYLLTLQNGAISMTPLLEKPAKTKRAHVWQITPTYLEDVTKDPEYYIENPARLNWDWLY